MIIAVDDDNEEEQPLLLLTRLLSQSGDLLPLDGSSLLSLFFKVKDGVSHPSRSLGNMITKVLKGPNIKANDGEKHSFTKENPIQPSSLPGLKIPRMELPAFDFSNDEN